MASRFVLGLDLGTTGVRALLYTPSGQLAASAYTGFRQYYPYPGWVEHDAEEIFSAILKMIRRACVQARADFSQFAAIGITNQRETVVVWDKRSGKPVANAIVWQDRRTELFCNALKKRGLEKKIRQKTGLVLDPYFSATKIKWLLDNVPGIHKKVKSGHILAGTVDSWVLWKLTGRHATDYTNASRTLLFDIHKRKWDIGLLKLFGVPLKILPEALPSGGFFGKTMHRQGVVSPGVPVYAMLGDQQASLYGQNCVRLGEVKNTYGTGCFMMMNVGTKAPRPKHGILTTLAVGPLGKSVYAFEGAVFIGGAVVQWLRDELGLIMQADETEKLALSVADTHGMTLIPAFVGLGSPYWRSDVRGVALGLTRGVTRAHFVRAAIEAIAQQSADVLDAMKKASRAPIREIRTDGKAAMNRFLMQFQADLIGLPVRSATQSEITAWGVIRLAGEMIDFWKNGFKQSDVFTYRTYSPKVSSLKRREMRALWGKSIKMLLSSSLS